MSALPARAQDSDPLAKLDPRNRFTIELLLDSAETAGLPTKPLLSKALEGIAKHVDDRRIILVVRRQLGFLRQAREALGPVGEEELTAGASVLEAGGKIEQLKTFRPRQKDRTDLEAFTVWADLMTRGIPGEDAFSAITKLWQTGADDATFYSLWKSINTDILQGLNPSTALQNRIREAPGRATSTPVKPPERQQENQRSQ